MDAAQLFRVANYPPGVVPAGAATMAQDDAMGSALSWAQSSIGGLYSDGQTFLGYPELALLAQQPEYRRISEIIAMEMTRKWVKIITAGEEDKTPKITALEAAMKRFDVQDCFKQLAEQDGLFGRSHLYLDSGHTDDRDELKMDIGNGRSEASRAKIGRGFLRRLRVIEAVWCYPSSYNSIDPLKGDWYNPSSWFVMGKEIHASRLLTFIGRDVPDILKPAYSFGGLSLTQMAKPYVDNWIRTRQSTADIVNAYSVFVLKTNMSETLAMDEGALERRADVFNNLRNNRGLWILDNEREDFANVSAPLGTLDKLEAQSQEHMAAVCGIPVVKLLGITPSGLNTSTDGEMEAFYTWINAQQESLFRKPLTRLLNIMQLSEFGEVDPDITFEFEPLKQLDEKTQADVRKVEAETGDVLIRSGAISRIEERQRIAADESSPYASLDVSDVPGLSPEVKAEIGIKTTAAVIEAVEAGMLDIAKGLTELSLQAPVTGLFTSITKEDIIEAELMPPEPPEVLGAPPGANGQEQPLVPDANKSLLPSAPKPQNKVKREVSLT